MASASTRVVAARVAAALVCGIAGTLLNIVKVPLGLMYTSTSSAGRFATPLVDAIEAALTATVAAIAEREADRAERRGRSGLVTREIAQREPQRDRRARPDRGERSDEQRPDEQHPERRRDRPADDEDTGFGS